MSMRSAGHVLQETISHENNKEEESEYARIDLIMQSILQVCAYVYRMSRKETKISLHKTLLLLVQNMLVLKKANIEILTVL